MPWIGGLPAPGFFPEMAVRFTMDPPPASFIIGTTSLEARVSPISLRSMSAARVSSATASKRTGCVRAGIVDQHRDGSELGGGAYHHSLDAFGVRHAGGHGNDVRAGGGLHVRDGRVETLSSAGADDDAPQRANGLSRGQWPRSLPSRLRYFAPPRCPSPAAQALNPFAVRQFEAGRVGLTRFVSSHPTKEVSEWLFDL